MKQKFYNDQREIANRFIFEDVHICQMAHLASQKISTLKLSYVVEAYKESREALYELVKRTLFRYVTSKYVLRHEKFDETTLPN